MSDCGYMDAIAGAHSDQKGIKLLLERSKSRLDSPTQQGAHVLRPKTSSPDSETIAPDIWKVPGSLQE